MDYQWHYNRLIETRKDRILDPSIYYERHLIVPKSMGGIDDPTNMISLTLREHFLAHLLLWKIHRNRPMAAAFVYMTGNMRKQNFVLSSRMYEQVKLAARENGQYNKGIPKTLETRLKMSTAQKNRAPMSDKTKNKISQSRKSLTYSSLTEEHKTKISVSNKGKNLGKISPFKDKQHSSKSKEIQSEKAKERTGDKNGFYGKMHSDETRKRLSKSWESRGPVKNETKEKLSKLSKGTIWINKDGINKKIKPDELDEWISVGWVKGKITHKQIHG